jgi:hypothetical protein
MIPKVNFTSIQTYSIYDCIISTPPVTYTISLALEESVLGLKYRYSNFSIAIKQVGNNQTWAYVENFMYFAKCGDKE